MADEYAKSVFLNGPYDEAYWPMLRAAMFAIQALGFAPRLAAGSRDSGELRFAKLVGLVGGCRLAIHDLSRVRAAAAGDVARLNMAFELGLDLGARWLYEERYSDKRCLVLAGDRDAAMHALSDLGGFDIESHEDDPMRAMEAVRYWLVDVGGLRDAQGAAGLWARFADFTGVHRLACRKCGLSDDEQDRQPASELLGAMRNWLKSKPA